MRRRDEADTAARQSVRSPRKRRSKSQKLRSLRKYHLVSHFIFCLFSIKIIFNFSEEISMDDYFLRSAEFRTWLSKEV